LCIQHIKTLKSNIFLHKRDQLLLFFWIFNKCP